jgi:hypothetical protein
MNLHENNNGKLKVELISGLCSKYSARLSVVDSDMVLYKRSAAAFKYLFAYFVNRAYISHLSLSCRGCYNVDNQHTCKQDLENVEKRSQNFYTLLNTVDKVSLKNLFDEVFYAYCGQENKICTCILFYKCLTIWRPLMRKQFIHKAIPKGLDSRLMSIIGSVLQKWENQNR